MTNPSQRDLYRLRRCRQTKFIFTLDQFQSSFLLSLLLLWISLLNEFTVTLTTAMSSTTPNTIRSSPQSSTSTATAAGVMASKQFIHPYQPPSWAKDAFRNVPVGRLKLAQLPTPLYPLLIPNSPSSNWLTSLQNHNIQLWIKRDDMTGGLELGGNKIRKLEFLLADALQQHCTAVVTIGGMQSNHARATAAAARMVGLQPHLILRTKQPIMNSNNDPTTLVGNLLVNRMVGSQMYTCTPGEYGRIGSDELVRSVGRHVQEQLGQVPYLIPVGGSNALGSWGYIQAVDELLQQWNDVQDGAVHEYTDESFSSSLDHVVVACGSGGTAAGVCLGMALAHGALSQLPADPTSSTRRNKTTPHVHAIGVCDDPDYFYRHVAQIATDMGIVVQPSTTTTATDVSAIEELIKQHMTVYQGKGLGYAASTEEELEFVANFASDTGVVLDPVYTGKALYHFVQHVLLPNLESFGNSNVLFWHTGGGLGLYDKANDLLPLVQATSLMQRLDIYGTQSGEGVDISKTIM